MAKLLTIRDNSVTGNLTGTDITGDVILKSDEQSNSHSSNLYRGVRVDIKFNELNADSGVEVQAMIEGKDLMGNWSVVAYQFDPYRSGQSSTQRIIVVDPTVFWPDAGVSNIVYVGGKTIAEISPQQIILPDTWRVCVKILVPEQSNFNYLNMDINAEMINPEK